MRFTRIVARKSVAAGIGVVAALAAGGTAYAASGSSGSDPSPPASAGTVTPAAHPKPHRTLLGRADHAAIGLEVKGAWVTYTLDRGKVAAVSPGSITLARPDGQSVTEVITPTTKFRGVTSEAGIQLHRPATVVSEGGSALRIGQANPDRNGPAGTGSPQTGGPTG